MKKGDLVKWSQYWKDTRSRTEYIDFETQIGVLLEDLGLGQVGKVLWSCGRTRMTHRDYLEALCK